MPSRIDALIANQDIQEAFREDAKKMLESGGKAKFRSRCKTFLFAKQAVGRDRSSGRGLSSFSKEDKILLFEDLGVEEGATLEEKILRVCDDIWGFACIKERTLLEQMAEQLEADIRGGRRVNLLSQTRYIGKRYESFRKEKTRSDNRTLSSLYRQVQRGARKAYPGRLYGDGQWFGPCGLDDRQFEALRSRSRSFDDPGSPLIPLPAGAPELRELQRQGQMNIAPAVRLLPGLLAEVKARGFGEVISLRSFCFWLNQHYALVSGLVPVVAFAEDADLLSDLPSKDLPVDAQLSCAQAASACFDSMTPLQKRILAFCDSSMYAADIATLCNLDSAGAARREKGKIHRLIEGYLRECCDDDGADTLFLERLFAMCREFSSLATS